jgi:hypothetical protein
VSRTTLGKGGARDKQERTRRAKSGEMGGVSPREVRPTEQGTCEVSRTPRTCQDGPPSNWAADAPWPQQLDRARRAEWSGGRCVVIERPGPPFRCHRPGARSSQPTGALRRAPFFLHVARAGLRCAKCDLSGTVTSPQSSSSVPRTERNAGRRRGREAALAAGALGAATLDGCASRSAAG